MHLQYASVSMYGCMQALWLVLLLDVQAQQVAVLESESLRLKEEMKQMSCLLEASKKSKANSEERLEELRALVSKVSTTHMLTLSKNFIMIIYTWRTRYYGSLY